MTVIVLCWTTQEEDIFSISYGGMLIIAGVETSTDEDGSQQVSVISKCII